MNYIVLVNIVLGALSRVDAARILAVFPVPSISHQIVFRPLTQELARRGHDVIVITPDPAFPNGRSPRNLTEIDVHNVSYSVWHKELKKVAVGRETDMDAQLEMFIHLYLVLSEQLLLSNEIQHNILNHNIQFDLILGEACVRPTLIFSHIFKAPYIQVSSFGSPPDTNAIVGAPNHPLLQPIVLRQRLYNLTLWEKIREIYQQFRFEHIFYGLEQKENVMLKRIFGPSTPTLSELYNNVDMIFLNVHPIWHDNQPVPPNVIYMGGLHQTSAKELPENFKSFLDSSKDGVIYMSFGTNVQPSILPPQKINIMIKVLSELPYDVMWKWDTNLLNKSSNIKVFKWLPQSDILQHPKLKLFITQGGLQSTDEAITAGVPLIGIPIIADQWYNVEKYILHGTGVKLEMGTFTEEEFRNAIITVIEDQSYRNNVIRLRTLMRDQPQTPLERAVWWVEHVLRHGGARHLRSPAANMSWADYYELQLLLIVLACLITGISTTYVTIYYMKRYVCKNIIPKIKQKLS